MWTRAFECLVTNTLEFKIRVKELKNTYESEKKLSEDVVVRSGEAWWGGGEAWWDEKYLEVV